MWILSCLMYNIFFVILIFPISNDNIYKLHLLSNLFSQYPSNAGCNVGNFNAA